MDVRISTESSKQFEFIIVEDLTMYIARRRKPGDLKFQCMHRAIATFYSLICIAYAMIRPIGIDLIYFIVSVCPRNGGI